MTDDTKKPQSDVSCGDNEHNRQTFVAKDAGDPVQTALGDFGWWQFWITFALSLLKFPIAWHQLAIIFLAAKTPFRCADVDDGGAGLFNATDRCGLHDPLTHAVVPCHRFVYNRSVFQETIITEWDLVCGRFQLSNIAQSVFMFGVLIGNVLFGMFSDKYGRKIPMMFAIVLLLVAGVGTSLAPWYELFLPLRFATALAIGGLMISSFVLTMEVVGGKWRTVVSTLHHIPFNLGHMSMALISYFIRNWRQFQLAITLPSLFFFTYWWIIPESPRWLLAVGNEKQARKILAAGARRNNRKLDGQFETTLNSRPEKTGEDNKGNLFDLFRTTNLRKKTLAVFFNWMVCGLCFYGLAQYMGEIGGNIFVNVASSGLIELPGAFLCIYLMERFGRRNTLLSANLVTAVACILITFLPQNSEVEHLKFMLASLGIIGSSIAFPTIYLFSGELFPTVVRNVGVGSASMCARIGSIIAPFVSSLGVFNVYLPPMIFGTVPLVGAVLCLLLPETKGAQLPVTIEDGERFGLKTKSLEKTMGNGTQNSGFVADEQL